MPLTVDVSGAVLLVEAIYEIWFYGPLDTKIGHFRDVLPSQLLCTVLKKLNLTQRKSRHTQISRKIL